MIDATTLAQAALARYRAKRVTERDHVVILASTANYGPLVEAYYRGAVLAGADPLLIVFRDRPRFSGLPPAVVRAAADADVLADLNLSAWVYTDSHAQVVRALRERGARWVWTAGFEEGIENFLRTPPGDPLVAARFRKVKQLIDGATRIHITSQLGTSLTIARGNPEERVSHPPADWPDAGVVGFAPPEEEVNGSIAFVGALRIQGPRLYKRHITTPIRMTVTRGRLTDIQATHPDARFLRDWFASFDDPLAYQFAHTNLGFDHRVILEPLDNYAVHVYFGGVLLAFGMNYSPFFGAAAVRARNHVDMLLIGASYEIDGRLILEGGRFTEESGLLNPSLEGSA